MIWPGPLPLCSLLFRSFIIKFWKWNGKWIWSGFPKFCHLLNENDHVKSMAWFTACLCCLCLHSKMMILLFRKIKPSSCRVRWNLTWTFACNLTAMLCTRHAEIGSCFLSQTRSHYIFIPTLLNKTLYPSVNSVCSVNNTTRQCKWEYTKSAHVVQRPSQNSLLTCLVHLSRWCLNTA